MRAELRTLLWACLAALALAGFGPTESRALDPVGLEVAADEVRTALADMTGALNATPREVQTTISADLHLMGQAITRTLGRIEDGVVPIADPTLVYDLNFLADIAAAATGELQAFAAEDAGGLAPDRVARIEALADAAAARLVEVNLVIDGWTERGRNAVVELAEENGEVVIKTTDRLIHNGVRYASVGLLLVGLLVVGLQLLRLSEDRIDTLALLRETPVLSSLAVIALTLFFAGCIVFSLHPATLAALSAEVRQQPQEHPCERLAEQRDRLITAQQVEHAGLVEATKQRMTAAARDCLGLPSGTATAEAIDRLAARTAVARNDVLHLGPVASAGAAVGPAERVGEGDRTATENGQPAAQASDEGDAPEVAQPLAQASEGGVPAQNGQPGAQAGDGGDAPAEIGPSQTQARENSDAPGEVEQPREQASDVEGAGRPESAEAQERANLGAAMSLPELTEPSDPARIAQADALTDLAARIKSAEEMLSERLEGALADRLEEAEITPALGPEPAGDPAATATPADDPAETLAAAGVPEPKPPAPAAAPVPEAESEEAPELYVTTTAVNYRAGPSLEAPRLGTFVPGATLAVIEQSDGWSEVRLGDGREVFVASEFLELAP